MRLLEEGVEVVGFDNLNPCYDSSLKGVLILSLKTASGRSVTPFTLIEANLDECNAVCLAFNQYKPAKVVNLAAQAGLRCAVCGIPS